MFIVLGISAVFEGASWVVGFREFRAQAGGRSFWAAFRASKDPPTFMVVFEDSAALAGLAVAAAGTGLALVTGDRAGTARRAWSSPRSSPRRR